MVKLTLNMWFSKLPPNIYLFKKLITFSTKAVRISISLIPYILSLVEKGSTLIAKTNWFVI